MARILSSILLLLISSLCFSQLSKEEKKKWKKEMKMVGVEGYKEMSEENTALILEKRQLESDIADYKRAAKEYADQISALETQQDSLSLLNTITETSETKTEVSNDATETGILFKVQIGAYKKFDLTDYFNNHKNFGGEIDDDGTMKYTLGLFRNYNKADTFKKLMVEMGVKGAWVVAYKDNKRIPLNVARNQIE